MLSPQSASGQRIDAMTRKPHGETRRCSFIRCKEEKMRQKYKMTAHRHPANSAAASRGAAGKLQRCCRVKLLPSGKIDAF
jgi:hypothetical protein